MNDDLKLYNSLTRGGNSTYNAIGRTASSNARNKLSSNSSNSNFFTKRASSIGNAVGTTLSAPISLAHDIGENIATQKFLSDSKTRMNDVAKKYGYNTWSDWQDAYYAAKDAGDTAKVAEMEPQLKEFQAQANANSAEANAKAKGYEDYRQNNLISKNINQDNGKFLGSAINTLSTAVDITGLGATPVANAIQGAVEGIADELEQNGGNIDFTQALEKGVQAKNWDDFSVERAGQNALIGAATGAVTGSLNKGLSNSLAKKGGNLFKGNNALTAGINRFGANHPVMSTIATGAGRGALSGAVGGATGAGLSSALNGVEIGEGIQNTLQGAAQGAAQGAWTGATMAGANTALSKTPGVGKFYNELQSTQDRWKKSGSNFDERLANTITSGDSKVGNYIMDKGLGGAFGVESGAETGVSNPNNYGEVLNRGMNQGLSGDELGDELANYSGLPKSVSGDDLYRLAQNDPDLQKGIAYVASQQAEDGSNPTYNSVAENSWDEVRAQYAQAKNYQGPGDYFEETERVTMETPSKTSNSAWDNLAKEAGYNNYDEVVQAYQKANPNAKINAGAVLTWLDNNPAEATTPVQTSKQIKGQRKLIEEITNQFNAPDKPTVRATKPQETFKNLYENWGLSDGDDIRQAISYAEPGSLIPKMISEAAGEAGIIDLSDAQSMVLDLGLRKNSNYKKTVAVLSDIWDSMPNEDIVGGKSGVNALKFQRAVESAASDAMGTSGEYHIGNNIVDQTTAQNLMRIANNIGDKLDEAATAKGAVQNVLNRHSAEIQQMRNAFPNNEKWQNAIDTEISGATTIRDLRHSIKDLTRANIFITNGDENFSTVGGRMSARYNDLPTTKAGVRNKAVNAVWDKIADSKLAKNLRLKSYDKQMRGDTAETTGVATQPTETPTPATPVNNNYNPTTQLFNAIGRTEGLTNAEQARTAQYLTNAVAEENGTPKAPNAGVGSLEELVAPQASSTTSTSVYDSVYGTPTTTTGSSASQTTNYFQPTGDYWTDILANAMSRAIDADDVTAFASLYGMYQDALSKIQKQTTSTQKLSSTQQRANAAMNSLERLSGMTPDLAYNLSNIPLIGGIATLGGNDYESEAKSLAQQIGYMVSGSNIKDSEAEAIGKSYVPQPWDNEQVRQNKLRRAYEIISQYQNGYAE